KTRAREGGNGSVSNPRHARSTNEAVKMQKLASWIQKIWTVAENEGSEDRRGFPPFRWDYGSPPARLQAGPPPRCGDAGLRHSEQRSAIPISSILASNPIVAKRIEA